MVERSKLKRGESKITIFKNGQVAFTNLVSELIDVALEVNPEDQRILNRKMVKERRVRENASQTNRRD